MWLTDREAAGRPHPPSEWPVAAFALLAVGFGAVAGRRVVAAGHEAIGE